MAALDGVAMGALVWPTKRDWRLAASDMVRGLLAWEIWTLLGVSDIRQRYKRSRLGQFWITASMAIFIVSIGVVYSLLFNQPIYDYVPLLAVKHYGAQIGLLQALLNRTFLRGGGVHTD